MTNPPTPSPPDRDDVQPQPPRRFDDPALLAGSPALQQLAKQLEPHFADLATRHLYTVFGVADLLPMPDGEAMTVAQAAALVPAAYLRQLTLHPVGVRCGPESQNLYALMIPEALCAAFLMENPVLEKTLLVLTPSGSILVFLRLKDRPPYAGLTAEGTWFGPGQVVRVFAPGPHGGFLCLHAAEPAEVTFAELRWDSLPHLHLEFRLGALTCQHGPELIAFPADRPCLNVNFWGAFCVSELGIRYDTEAKEFHRVSPASQDPVRVTAESIMADVARVLLLRSQSPGRQALVHQREYRHLRRILDMVKVLGAVEPPDGRENLVRFLVAAVEFRPGGSVTAGELFRGYRVFCSTNQVTGGSPTWFHQHATPWLKQHLQVEKSHSIIRDGTARRGFRDLGLRPLGTKPEGLAAIPLD